MKIIIKKSSVRAWEIVALAERGYKKEAKKSLQEALNLAAQVTPLSSCCEALFYLYQASFSIDINEAMKVFEHMKSLCPSSGHWRAKRAINNGEKMLQGEHKPREYFW